MNVLFIDSGIGGITTLCECVKQCPNLNFIYYADNKFAPYGRLSCKAITKRLISIINSQLKNDIGLIVLACNTATANSINYLRKHYKTQIIGTEPAINLLKKEDKALVLATVATTKHKRFKHLVRQCNKKVKLRPKKHLAKIIEDYLTDSSRQNKIKLEKEMQIIKKQAKNYTHIVLGCTHYVYIKEKLQKLTNTTFLDGNYGVSKQVKRFITPEFTSKNPTQLFVLSKNNSEICKKYIKIFKQTLANTLNVC